MRYRIVTSDTDLGAYEGNTASEALESMAKCAGYHSWEELCGVTGHDMVGWTTVEYIFLHESSPGFVLVTEEPHDE